METMKNELTLLYSKFIPSMSGKIVIENKYLHIYV